MSKHTLSEIFQHFGSKAAVAKTLGISPQAVHNWGEKIPAEAALKLELITKGELRAADMPVNFKSTA